jgi:hypothetical protein
MSVNNRFNNFFNSLVSERFVKYCPLLELRFRQSVQVIFVKVYSTIKITMELLTNDTLLSLTNYLPVKSLSSFGKVCMTFSKLRIPWRRRVEGILFSDAILSEETLKKLNLELDLANASGTEDYWALFAIDDESIIPHVEGLVMSGKLKGKTPEIMGVSQRLSTYDNRALTRWFIETYLSETQKFGARAHLMDLSGTWGKIKCFGELWSNCYSKDGLLRNAYEGFHKLYKDQPDQMVALLKDHPQTIHHIRGFWNLLVHQAGSFPRILRENVIAFFIEFSHREGLEIPSKCVCLCALNNKIWDKLLECYPGVVENLKDAYETIYESGLPQGPVYDRFVKYCHIESDEESDYSSEEESNEDYFG